ncbi:sulfurtransferase [Terrisporobacter sp.]|uniref:sulfurtransferase n=1 Tax=Terrisporobacter sp. TaxID=1965305 RepID=UPI00262372C6|nr:sulfurtransferase [Terrisporobacter sp.]
MKNIVTPKWLKENLQNEKLVLVDCRFSLMDKEYGKRSYEESHIKGAVRIDVETELSAPVKEHGGRHPLPNVEDLKITFENIGISNDSIVVAYDEGDLSGPARLWWILKYLGHDKVYVLNGGINNFAEIGGEINSEKTEVKKGKFEVNSNENMRVNMEYVRERLNKENIAIVDCRENIRYSGEFEPVDKKSGHIPGALNYFWMDILNKNEDRLTIKSEKSLEEYFNKVKDFGEVIIYCGSGITASPVSLALTEIDIDHKLYTGSFSDWISYEENDIDTI